MSSMSGANRGSGFGTPGLPQTTTSGNLPGTSRTSSESGAMGAVKEKVGDLASSASRVASDVTDTAKQWASSAAGSVEQGWDTTRQSVVSAFDECTAFIRRHPGASLLAAFGVGALVGSALVLFTEDRHPLRY